MPINYKLYPPNWKTELRPAVLQRAKNACEFCKVPNYAVARWNGDKYETTGEKYATIGEARKAKDKRLFRDWIIIVLTVAHLDHDIGNNELSNLRALCQRCHLDYDREDNSRRRKYGKHHERRQMKIEFFKNG